jgi:hypothetical protein
MLAEIELFLATLWGHGLFPPVGFNVLSINVLCHKEQPVFYLWGEIRVR